MATFKLTKDIKAVITTEFKSMETWEDLKKCYVKYISDAPTKTCKDFIDKLFGECAPAVKNIHKNHEGKTYQKAPKESPEDFRKLIGALLEMEGVTVEVCGTWLWVTGNTKANKEALKAVGFRWAAKKKAWYKAPEGTPRRRTKKGWDMAKIRDVYGSHVVEEVEEIA